MNIYIAGKEEEDILLVDFQLNIHGTWYWQHIQIQLAAD